MSSPALSPGVSRLPGEEEDHPSVGLYEDLLAIAPALGNLPDPLQDAIAGLLMSALDAAYAAGIGEGRALEAEERTLQGWEIRQAACALLDIYSSDPEASDGPDADAA